MSTLLNNMKTNKKQGITCVICLLFILFSAGFTKGHHSTSPKLCELVKGNSLGLTVATLRVELDALGMIIPVYSKGYKTGMLYKLENCYQG